MPIEFYCSSCQSKLRTGDDTVGKGARCPNCGNIEIVPESSSPPIQQSAGLDVNEFRSLDRRTPADSFRPTVESENPFATPQSDASNYRAQSNAESARQKLAVPAIVLMVFYGLGLLFSVFGLLGFALEAMGKGLQGDDFAGLIFLGFVVVIELLVLVGCFSMLRLKNYGLCVVAAVASILSGFTCCLIPAGFGIWATIVLLDPEVKRFFQ